MTVVTIRYTYMLILLYDKKEKKEISNHYAVLIECADSIKRITYR